MNGRTTARLGAALGLWVALAGARADDDAGWRPTGAPPAIAETRVAPAPRPPVTLGKPAVTLGKPVVCAESSPAPDARLREPWHAAGAGVPRLSEPCSVSC